MSKLKSWRGIACVLVSFLGVFDSLQAVADNFPNRRITLTVPTGAGATTDIFGRIVGEALGAQLGQAVVIENKPGAGGTLASGQVVRSAADGYSLIVATSSSIPINNALYRDLPYSISKDLTVVGIVSSSPNALIVPADQGINSIEDLVSKAKAQDRAKYFSPGSGTSQHLSAVLFSHMAGFQGEHIPYRGQEGIAGMLGGQTLFGFASAPSVAGLVNGGKLKVLGTTGTKVSTAFPSAPLLADVGYKDFSYGEIWYGIAVRSDTSVEIKNKLFEALQQVSQNPATREKLAKVGFDPVLPMKREALDYYVESQLQFWGDLVVESGAKVE